MFASKKEIVAINKEIYELRRRLNNIEYINVPLKNPVTPSIQVGTGMPGGPGSVTNDGLSFQCLIQDIVPALIKFLKIKARRIPEIVPQTNLKFFKDDETNSYTEEEKEGNY